MAIGLGRFLCHQELQWTESPIQHALLIKLAGGHVIQQKRKNAGLSKGATTTSARRRVGVRKSHPGPQRGPRELEPVSDVSVDGED
jgi:hypothetical protein